MVPSEAVMTLIEEAAAGETPPVRELAVDDIDGMLGAGVLREGGPFELIEGFLVRKDRDAEGGDGMTYGPRHALVVSSLVRLGSLLEPHGYCLRAQLPVVLSETSAPEPDIAILRGTLDDFASRHPGAEDVAAVIEVADHSLAYDRSIRQRLYATAGIPQFWIVNLVDDQLEVFDQPDPEAGSHGRCIGLGPATTAMLTLGPRASLEIPVASLLAP